MVILSKLSQRILIDVITGYHLHFAKVMTIFLADLKHQLLAILRELGEVARVQADSHGIVAEVLEHEGDQQVVLDA